MIKAVIVMVAAIIGLTVVLVLPLRWQNPATTMFVFNDDSVESVWVYQRWSHISDISEMMQLAVIASEDQKFPQHFGFDFIELKKALLQSGGPTRGASTITQQLVKNLYLWKGKSIFRKAIEAYMTLVVEILLPKERILELYLNVVEFGVGVYGVEQAAAVFFDKTPQKLNRVEASLLAAVLPNPKKLLVSKPSPYVYNRALDIRFSMRALGGLGYLQRLKSNGKAGSR